MKQITLSITFLLFLIVPSKGQTDVAVSMNTGYTDDVFVSMANGEVSTVSSMDWDLAFDVSSSFSTSIRINDGQGTQLFIWPNGTIDEWNEVDTVGLSAWGSINNELDSWDKGAFNVSNSGSPSDFSWGYYTGDPLHDVVGDSIYLLKTLTDDWKKVKIELLDAGEWTFTLADLDGNNEVQENFAMADYAERNFVYYSVNNEAFLNREPEANSWDLIFTRYYGQTAFGPGGTAGCLANKGIELIQADGVDVSSVEFSDYVWVTEDISVIGNDWKGLNADFMWEIVADKCYFIKTLSGDIYKLIFTSFEGSENGNLSYTTELITGSSIDESMSFDQLTLYPNPAFEKLNVLLTSKQQDQANVSIKDITGNTLLNDFRNLSQGVNSMELNVQALSSGMYILTVETSSNSSVSRFIVK